MAGFRTLTNITENGPHLFQVLVLLPYVLPTPHGGRGVDRSGRVRAHALIPSTISMVAPGPESHGPELDHVPIPVTRDSRMG